MATLDWEKARRHQRMHELGTLPSFTPYKKKKRKKNSTSENKQTTKQELSLGTKRKTKKKHLKLVNKTTKQEVSRGTKRNRQTVKSYLSYARDAILRGERPVSIPHELRLEIEAAGGPEQWARLRLADVQTYPPSAPTLRKRADLRVQARKRRLNRAPVRSASPVQRPSDNTNPVIEPSQEMIDNFRSHQRRRREKEMQQP